MSVLSASWEALTQRITENPTLAILKHVTECMAVLSNDSAESNESTSATDVIRSVAVSSFSLSVEKILLELMASQCQLTASETNQFTELGATIMKLYPASAKLERTGNSQKTLMHRIASRSSTLPETIRLVHAADPRCIESQDAMGALPLHHADVTTIAGLLLAIVISTCLPAPLLICTTLVAGTLTGGQRVLPRDRLAQRHTRAHTNTPILEAR